MSFIGVLEPFSGDDFEAYQERLEAYFSANDIGVITDENDASAVAKSDKKKVAHTIAVMGKLTYDTLKDLCLPAKPTDKKFSEICEMLKKYYKPSVLVVAESYKFHQAKQEAGESVTVFANRLRRLAVNCDYNNFLQRALRDQFVSGIRNPNSLKKLLAQDKTFVECLNVAIADETADRESKSLVGHESVNYTKGKTSRGSKPRCFRCGSEDHFADKCSWKASGITCVYCSRTGHSDKECFKKKRDENKKKRGVNYIADDVEVLNNTFAEVSMFMVSAEEEAIEGPTHMINLIRQKSFKTEVTLDGKSITMEIDTGSGVTLLSRSDFDQICGNVDSLQPSRLILKGYTGDKIKCLGEKLMSVQINGQVKDAVIRVVDGKGPSLLGRDLISNFTLPWENIFKINSSEYTDILQKYADLFDDSTVGRIEGVKVQLHVDNSKPIFKRARPVPYAIRTKYEEALEKLEEQQIIEKVEFSEWASPVVPVTKGDGSLRLCGDYSTTINKNMISDVYPLPTLEDIVNKVGYGENFTKLDLSQAFHQFELHKDSRKYTTINTIKGLYQYNRLVFGVPSATAICQRTMENILKGIPGVVVRVDDILVTGKDDSEHMQNLETVLSRLQEKGLKLKKSKVQFMLKEVEYNGFTISRNGVRPTIQKVEAIQSAEAPTNVTELRSFIGLANYLRTFVPNFAEIISPLYKLLRKETTWHWGKVENEAFNKLKDGISAEKILRRYNPEGDLVLQTDASGVGVGATILQHNDKGFLQPIAYASRILTKAEKNYPQIERELLGVVFGVTKFRLFVLGRKFILQTDHKPLTKICHEHETIPQLVSNRIKKWAMLLKAYDFKISHIPGKQNVVADFLSRKPINSIRTLEEEPAENLILFIEDNPVVKAECVAVETRKDPILKQVLEYTRNGWEQNPPTELLPYCQRRFEITVENGILLWGDRVLIPSSLREILLKDLHTEHMGIVRTKQLARMYLWWPRLDSEVENMIKVCANCQEHSKNPKSSDPGTWSWPAGPWKRLHIDFAGPETNGQMYFVIVDAYSKYLEIYPMLKTDALRTIEKLRHLFSQFGLPEHIVSDNGPQFISEEFKKFLQNNDIQHTKTPPRHPATNGLAERYVGYWKDSLKKMGDTSETLQAKLDRFLLTYRVTPTSMGKSPSELLMNRQPRIRFNALRFSKTKEQVKIFKENMNHVPKFQKDDAVFAKKIGKGADWMPGKIMEILSPKSFLVQVRDVVWKRNVDQLKLRTIPMNDPEKFETEERSSDEPRHSRINVSSNTKIDTKQTDVQTASEIRKEGNDEGDSPITEELSENSPITEELSEKVGNLETTGKRTSKREKRETKRYITES